MKKKISKNVRLGVIIFSIVIICGVLINIFVQRNEENEKAALYNYSNIANISYQVSLKPNSLFSERHLGETEVYLTEFVEHIDTDFTYEFNGESSANISGVYEIVAVLEGINNQGDGPKTVWKEEFIIKPSTDFNTVDGYLVITENIPLTLDKYIDFAEEVATYTRVRLASRLTVNMNINLAAETEHGMVEEKLAPSLVIPFGDNQFEILKNEIAEEKSLMGTMESIPSSSARILQIVIIVILVAVVVYTMVFTANAKPKGRYERKIEKVFKEHQERLVALQTEVINNHRITFRVKTFEDLVRVADELTRPIMYVYSHNYVDIKNFFVLDDIYIYLYDMSIIESNEPQEEGTSAP
ncbi:hypothetical protein HYG86_14895 [Alkalicella caledoniensis]|uniref:DUF5305 domain-containing protein n=1 Tax=Alkalicella caledoniensis TaxID=2731377 RepID=A0A7G9WB99_ALKCA|nr:DUF5305 family protein [Alkalicella caledoniensis]QNO15961.1 hypothetical protein HYG86_14895 [Alkalicella caledoniensis]